MPIAFNHTIVAAHDKRESAEFVSELFGLASPQPFGHFLVVTLEHGASLDYAEVAGWPDAPSQAETAAMLEPVGRNFIPDRYR